MSGHENPVFFGNTNRNRGSRGRFQPKPKMYQRPKKWKRELMNRMPAAVRQEKEELLKQYPPPTMRLAKIGPAIKAEILPAPPVIGMNPSAHNWSGGSALGVNAPAQWSK